jgi:hypothetical protein
MATAGTSESQQAIEDIARLRAEYRRSFAELQRG